MDITRLARGLPATVLLPAALLAGCGGGHEVPPQPAPALRSPATSGDGLAASNLMDLAESKFPSYFPSHKANSTEPPFLYRFYPETGVYIGVPVTSGTAYEYRGVYVMGGPFGNAPVYIAPMRSFQPSGLPPITPLASSSPTQTFTVIYSSTQIGVDQRTATATFALDNTMTSYFAATQEAPTIGTMANSEASGTANAQVGRWNDGAFAGFYYAAVNATSTINLSPSQGFHYVVANPAPTLPCGTATYTLAAGTHPTRNDGGAAPGVFDSFTLTASFAGTNTTTWSGTGAITFAGTQGTFSGSGSGKPAAPRIFIMDMATTPTTLGGVHVRGVFAGPDASEAALIISGMATTNETAKALRGAARLTRTSFTPGTCT